MNKRKRNIAVIDSDRAGNCDEDDLEEVCFVLTLKYN